MEKVVVELRRVRKCKHSVRYDAIEADKNLMLSVYLMNDAAKLLDGPEAIIVEVSRKEE